MMYSICQVTSFDLFVAPHLYPVSNKSYIGTALSYSTWNTYFYWKRHLKQHHMSGKYDPVVLVNSKWVKPTLHLILRRFRWGGGLCSLRNADPVVLLAGAEPGEVFGSDTLRSYYLPQPVWLSWVLKIALCQYKNPTFAMLMIKNAWIFNVKHEKGQWLDIGWRHLAWKPKSFSDLLVCQCFNFD